MASAMDGDTVNKTEKEERGDKNGGIFAKVFKNYNNATKLLQKSAKFVLNIVKIGDSSLPVSLFPFTFFIPTLSPAAMVIRERERCCIA